MTDTDPALVDAVLDLATADPDLAEDAKYLVVAALEGEAAFADELSGTGTRPERSTGPDVPAHQPVGAWLESITVAGFRGIGPERTLTLRPTEGLTVVAGRNGSGKSSFAEALEVALTGDSSRRRLSPTEWGGNWTNLHTDRPRSIRVALTSDTGAAQIGVDWPDTVTRFQDMRVWVQRPTLPRENGLDCLGWGEAMALCSPLLPHEELGRLLTAPRSELWDKLEKILGLGRFTAATGMLDAAHKEAAAPDKQRREALTPLKKRLAELPDERAQRAATELRKQKPDRSLLRALATGTAPYADGALAHLRTVADLSVPDAAALHGAAARLRAAAEHVTQDDDLDAWTAAPSCAPRR